jgi:MFS transporter, OFA family, oxalate/formate antiporter
LKRFLILLSAIVMQVCLGATYSWSVYVDSIKQLTGLNQGAAQVPFSLFYFAFPATVILAGMLLPRFGPRRCAVAGGVIFGCGWMLASFGDRHFAFTVLGIGLLGGVGAGLAYIVPIAVCIPWFPGHKGLVTGIAVAGFGGGAALVSQAGGYMMAECGVTPFQAFGLFGLLFVALVPCAGFFMRFPPGMAKSGPARLAVSAILRRREFAILFVAMLTGLAAGFAVNANLKQFSPGQTAKVCIMAVSLFAVANALGRITWGLISDKVDAATAIRANLIMQAIALAAALNLLDTAAGLWGFALLTGFNYGGVLVLYAATVARIWGSENVGQVYGLLFSANILAAATPVLAGYSYDAYGGFDMALSILAALLIAAALWVWKNAGMLNAAKMQAGERNGGNGG